MNQEEAMLEKLSHSKKTGYLQEAFRLFHITDQKQQEFEYHYHDFHKIVLTLSGDVTYNVEGKAYSLKPWDILLVSRYEVHKPVIHSDAPYERIIFWIQDAFFAQDIFQIDTLMKCFADAGNGGQHLLSPQGALRSEFQTLIRKIEQSLHSDSFGSQALSAAGFLELLVLINRSFGNPDLQLDSSAVQYDPQIAEILRYINENLSGDLSNQLLADRFYLSRYHLMHKFKDETGYTLHNYIEQKRLILASQKIRDGIPVMKASEESGFAEYSTFLRAFRKKYSASPKEFLQNNPVFSAAKSTE